MYDAVFEHQFYGLPIVRALLITDSEDTSLFTDVGLNLTLSVSLDLKARY